MRVIIFMKTENKRIFICFAAEDRYDVVEPIVYHIKNYGADVWYDRDRLLVGDNRQEINLNQGARDSAYSIVIISKHLFQSRCALEEASIIYKEWYEGNKTVFPVLYGINPDALPDEFIWIKSIIYKEITKDSGTREFATHLMCRITEDALYDYPYRDLIDVIDHGSVLPKHIHKLLQDYCLLDASNINSRITLLYAIYTFLSENEPLEMEFSEIIRKTFNRLFSETKLNIHVDYRDIWLLENMLCLYMNQLLIASRV